MSTVYRLIGFVPRSFQGAAQLDLDAGLLAPVDTGFPLWHSTVLPIYRGIADMDWPRLIGELQQGGMTQTQIAERCGARQSTISDLLNIEGRSPSFDLGVALIALHEEVIAKQEIPGEAPAPERA